MKKKLRITIEGKTYEVEVEEVGVEGAPVQAAPKVEPAKTAAPAPKKAPEQAPKKPISGEGEVVSAPIPGKVLSIKVQVGEKVSAGQIVLILEAMKMENEIAAPVDGEIKDILVTEGQAVDSGEGMLIIG